MKTRKLILFLVITSGIISLIVSTGNSHNNSAPNLECTSCHQGEGSAEIKLDGVPENYIPGKTYRITLSVISDNQSLGDVAGGFAVEASAGELMVTDRKNTQLSEGFLTHTQEGSAFRKWTFGWKAPVQKTGANLTIMAVAANGDYSPAGDVTGAGGFPIMPGK